MNKPELKGYKVEDIAERDALRKEVEMLRKSREWLAECVCMLDMDQDMDDLIKQSEEAI